MSRNTRGQVQPLHPDQCPHTVKMSTAPLGEDTARDLLISPDVRAREEDPRDRVENARDDQRG